jgi:glycosyltransferase involved in cell wall biosynthesis
MFPFLMELFDKMQMNMNSIAIITTQAFSMWNFRGPLIRALTDQGVMVYALAPDFDDLLRKRVGELGAVPVDYALSRTGMNPVSDISALFHLSQLLKRLSPDLTLTYLIKPVIYGSIAAWLARVPKRFSMIEGLGYVFMEDSESITWKRRILRGAISYLYKFALRLNQKIIFLNNDDIHQFVVDGIVNEKKVVRIDGIGLDLAHYMVMPSVLKPVTFILIARMLREKGIYEFVEAARQVRSRYPAVRFLLVGGVDQNPGSLTETELRGWVNEGLVEWPGHVTDVRPWFAQASVFVLPSYREGVPRCSQEAMAMGRPVITTDSIGCRETVADGVNGFMVPVRDPVSLARAMIRFIESPDLIKIMGREGRRIAEERFDVHAINRQIIEVLRS